MWSDQRESFILHRRWKEEMQPRKKSLSVTLKRVKETFLYAIFFMEIQNSYIFRSLGKSGIYTQMNRMREKPSYKINEKAKNLHTSNSGLTNILKTCSNFLLVSPASYLMAKSLSDWV